MSGDGRIGRLAALDHVVSADLDAIVERCHTEMGELAGSSILITGGSGFVARYVVEAILRFNETSSAPLCVLTLPTRRPELLRERYRAAADAGEVVVTDWPSLHGGARGWDRWDYVVHAAATANPALVAGDAEGTYRDAMEMTASVVDLARSSDARRIVLISSGAFYGTRPPSMTEIPESFTGELDPRSPTFAYARAKRDAESLVAASGIDHRIARLFSSIGPYQALDAGFAVPELIRQAATQGFLQLSGDGGAKRSYCYAQDVAAFVVRLLAGSPAHDVFNVGSREGTATIGEVADVIAAVFGGLEVHRGSSTESGVGRDYVPALDRMAEFCPPRVGLREAIARTCHSLFDRGLIARRPVTGLDDPRGD